MENVNENAGNGSWIKISRKILDWEWYSDVNTKAVFLDLLLNAQYKDTRYGGVEVKRGQLTTSVNAISERTGLSARNIRTALEHLQSTGEIDKQSNKHFTLITIRKYDTYQCNDKECDNLQERKNNKNNYFYKEVKEESSEGIPSPGGDSRSRSESPLCARKRLSSNLRIKNVSPEELILFVNSEVLNRSLGNDEENRLKELYSKHSPENTESTLVTFALKLLQELNAEFALKFKKKYASKIAPDKNKPFVLNDVFTLLYGNYSKKSVEGCRMEIENFYARLEGQNFKSKSGNEVDLPKFFKWLEVNLKLKTRGEEAPFTKEDLQKALPNEDERVIERLESKYDAYFRQGSWETKSGYPVTLDMFTGFFRKTIIEELKSEGYVPKMDKTVSRDGRKYFDPSKDADELIKRGFGRSRN